MYCTKKIYEDLYWVGGNDRRLALFENIYPISRGVSYNSYVLLDEQTVLLDTVDRAINDLFFENLEHVLAGRTLDYVIVNHMEPDHCASRRSRSSATRKHLASSVSSTVLTLTAAHSSSKRVTPCPPASIR